MRRLAERCEGSRIPLWRICPVSKQGRETEAIRIGRSRHEPVDRPRGVASGDGGWDDDGMACWTGLGGSVRGGACGDARDRGGDEVAAVIRVVVLRVGGRCATEELGGGDRGAGTPLGADAPPGEFAADADPCGVLCPGRWNRGVATAQCGDGGRPASGDAHPMGDGWRLPSADGLYLRTGCRGDGAEAVGRDC